MPCEGAQNTSFFVEMGRNRINRGKKDLSDINIWASYCNKMLSGHQNKEYD